MSETNTWVKGGVTMQPKTTDKRCERTCFAQKVRHTARCDARLRFFFVVTPLGPNHGLGSCEPVGLLWTHNECLPLSTKLAWDFHAGPVLSHLQHRAFDPIFLTFRYIERPRIDRLNFVSWTSWTHTVAPNPG